MGSRKVFCMLSFLLAATRAFAADYAVPRVSLDAEREILIWEDIEMEELKKRNEDSQKKDYNIKTNYKENEFG